MLWNDLEMKVKHCPSVERKILYFEKPGPHNTGKLVNAVKERVKEGDIKYVVVASISGQTALKVAQALKDKGVSVVCVSGFRAGLPFMMLHTPL